MTKILQPQRHVDPELRREALTMGLYVSVTLLGALAVVDGGASTELNVLAVVWGTTVGLALTHWFTFTLAARLATPHVDKAEVQRDLLAQLAGSAVVAATATTAILLLPPQWERSGVRFVTAALIGIVTFAEVRAYGGSKSRSMLVAGSALVLSLVVAGIKHALSH